MLRLQGSSLGTRGFDETVTSHLVRLRLPEENPSGPFDAALVLSPDGASLAFRNKFDCAVTVGEDADQQKLSFSRSVALPAVFDYLRAGDILSLRPNHKRVRTLYRRGSKHNAFLVTERATTIA